MTPTTPSHKLVVRGFWKKMCEPLCARINVQVTQLGPNVEEYKEWAWCVHLHNT